ncbi:MAG: ATP-binding protein [Deltaproteobacteria bacterium]|nr:ATP-binding protein [Deltaproteobacteria bacterium]
MLQQIRLSNFKGFRQGTIPLGRFTMLLGANAAGKSNVRDALRFLHGLSRGYALAEVLGEKWAEGGILQWKGLRGGTREAAFHGQSAFELGISIEAPSETGHEMHKLEYSVEVTVGHVPDAPRVSRESLYMDGTLVFDSHPAEESPKQLDGDHLVVRLRRGGRNRRLGAAMTFLSSRAVLAQIAEKDGVDHEVILEAVHYCLSALQRMHFFELSPDSMRAPSIPGQVSLGLRGENLSSVLMAICEHPKRKADLLEMVTQFAALELSDLAFPEDYSGKVLVHFVEASGLRVSAHSASAGLLRFLAIVAAILEPDRGRFYFFEELEHSIHPTRLKLLLDLIEKQCAAGAVQMAVTSHSAQLLGLASPSSRESAIIVHRRAGVPGAQTIRLIDLPDIHRVIETRGLGQPHACGWLHDAIEYLSTL